MISSVSTATAGVALAAQKDGMQKVAKQFEAVFLRQMIGSMRANSLADDVFGSSAGDQFRDMQDSKLADSMSDKGVFGIADLLMKQFHGTTATPDATTLAKAAAAAGTTPAADAAATSAGPPA